MAEADAARGRVDAGYYPGLVWADCHIIPAQYIPSEEVAEDPERAYSCAVNQWRNCVAENILKEQYGAEYYPSGRDFLLGPEEEGHFAGYDREMRRLAEVRFRAELEPLRQGLIARRVEHAACGNERRQVAAVESLVTTSRGAEADALRSPALIRRAE